MVRRVTGPWNAAALPEIMAGALQESKLDVPVLFHEGRAVGQQLGAAGVRGSGAAEARARPNVSVKLRAALARAVLCTDRDRGDPSASTVCYVAHQTKYLDCK